MLIPQSEKPFVKLAFNPLKRRFGNQLIGATVAKQGVHFTVVITFVQDNKTVSFIGFH